MSPIVGSLERTVGIPDDLKAIYRTVWDMDPRTLVNMAIDRAPFVDQSQSLTLAVRKPTPDVLVCFSASFGAFLVSLLP